MLNAASLLDTGALQDFNFPSQQHFLGGGRGKKTLSKVMPLTHAVQQNCCKVKVGESQIRGHPGPKKALDGKNGLPGITTTPGTIRTAFGGGSHCMHSPRPPPWGAKALSKLQLSVPCHCRDCQLFGEEQITACQGT